MATPAPTRSLEQEKKQTRLMQTTPSPTQYFAVFPGKIENTDKMGKKKKSHLHFCFFFRRIRYVDNCCFCVCVNWGRSKMGSVRGQEEVAVTAVPSPQCPTPWWRADAGGGSKTPFLWGGPATACGLHLSSTMDLSPPHTRSSKGDALRWAEVATQSLSCQLSSRKTTSAQHNPLGQPHCTLLGSAERGFSSTG